MVKKLESCKEEHFLPVTQDVANYSDCITFETGYKYIVCVCVCRYCWYCNLFLARVRERENTDIFFASPHSALASLRAIEYSLFYHIHASCSAH